jgi:hypothetical protein
VVNRAVFATVDWVVWLVECFNNRRLVLDLFADRMRDKCARAIFIKVDLTVASCCT